MLGFVITESTNSLTTLPDRDLSEYTSLLTSGQYTRFPIRKLLGPQGYIAVVTQQGEVVFTSNSSVTSFSQETLGCIPIYAYHSYPIVTSFRDEYGMPLTLISRSNWDENNEQPPQTIALLDSARNLVYGTLPVNETQLSEEAYGYLTQTRPAGYSTWKFAFSTEDGESLWLILYEQNMRIEEYSQIDSLWNHTVALFVVLYITIVVIMSFLLFHKVRRPLDILRQGLTSLTENHPTKPIEYHGPREFEEICNTFNQMTERLAQSEEQRQALESGRQKMLADISHDLKTPITVIQGYAKAIHDGVIPPEKTPQYLDIIYQKSIGLTDLINAFYEYSKLEHPDFTIAPSRLDLCEFAREYLALKYTELEVSGFTLDIDIPDTPVWCMLDRTCFVRVFENILSNAVKHNPPKTILHFSITTTDTTATILLADNGVGIPPEIANHIFEPFVVGDESRNTKQGSGLGLAISKKIVQAHKGTIRLLAPDDTWHTVFEICLPLA